MRKPGAILPTEGYVMRDADAAMDWTVLPPFLKWIGVHDLVVEKGSAEVGLIFDPDRHANGIGVAHGGVICTLLDAVMGCAAFSWGDRPAPIVTVDQSVQFIAALNGPVRASGRVVRAGRSLVFCSAEIRSVSGELIASGMGTFKKIDRMAAQQAMQQTTQAEADAPHA